MRRGRTPMPPCICGRRLLAKSGSHRRRGSTILGTSRSMCRRASQTTSSIPNRPRSFELEFDFLKHVLRASTDDGSFREVPLVPRDGSRILRATSCKLSLSSASPCASTRCPTKSLTQYRFREDHTHASYDPEYAQRFWRIFCKSIGCCANFGRLSLASAARSISFGAALI